MQTLKTRIKVTELNNGETTFLCQWKGFFKWKPFWVHSVGPGFHDCKIAEFTNLNQAKTHIDKEIEDFELDKARKHLAKVKKVSIIKYP